MNEPIWVWGLPFAAVTQSEAVTAVDRLIEAGRPSYFVTANTHYAMLTKELPVMAAVNAGAAFILADGRPIVWASRLRGTPLPERVAGSDLIFDLCELAARKGYAVYLLGGASGVGEAAADRLRRRYPGLRIVGVDCPPFREPTALEHEALIARVRAARPHLLFVAFGQPKGELWLTRHLEALGVPVSVQVGAALDFAAGRMRRAPRVLQVAGLEWLFRLVLEPRRLFFRYARNARFAAGMMARDLAGRSAPRLSGESTDRPTQGAES